MNVVKEIQRLNAREAALNINSVSGSWHDQFKDSAHVFVGGLPYELTEGDVICVMSQFGEIASINLVRDKESGKSKGFAFIKYVDQRSTVLAVDNMNGSQVKNRTLRVDHVQNYKVPKKLDEDGNEIEQDEDMLNNAMPKPVAQESASESESSGSEVDDTGIDPDDPMREYLLKKLKKKAKKAKRKAEKETKAEKKAERRARREEKKARKERETSKDTKDTSAGDDIVGTNKKNDDAKVESPIRKAEDSKVQGTNDTAVISRGGGGGGRDRTTLAGNSSSRVDNERDGYRARGTSRSRSPPPRHRPRSHSRSRSRSPHSSRAYESFTRPRSRSPVRRRRSLSRSPSPGRRDRYGGRGRSRSRSFSPRRRSPDRDRRDWRPRHENRSRSRSRSPYRYSSSRRREDGSRERREYRSRR